MKKYELVTELSKEFFGKTLFRIRALVSFGCVGEGEIGGWVESEGNLSHDGNAWVSDNARVYDNARVSGNGRVFGNAWVSDNARVSGNGRVFGNAWVSDNARVSGNVRVSGNARVSDNARVCGAAHYITVGPIGSEGGTLTAFRQADNSIVVTRGCFRGTIEEFVAAVIERHGETHYAAEYGIVIKLIEARLAEID
ncbi:polymer-forming cytoskeletal protein [Salmonella enterica subsp. enterica]|nr:polymer-forming cytoskeletal protein [Salmonella enterica subsp. enterica serovar Meleagridis]